MATAAATTAGIAVVVNLLIGLHGDRLLSFRRRFFWSSLIVFIVTIIVSATTATTSVRGSHYCCCTVAIAPIVTFLRLLPAGIHIYNVTIICTTACQDSQRQGWWSCGLGSRRTLMRRRRYCNLWRGWKCYNSLHLRHGRWGVSRVGDDVRSWLYVWITGWVCVAG